MNGYDRLKELQQTLCQQGVQVTLKNLLAMPPHNDPFYIGAPAQVQTAEWFAEIWNQWTSTTNHIRRIHYKLISQDKPSLMRNGKSYLNTEACWKEMNHGARFARILGLVDPDEFTDKRNDPTVVFLNPHAWTSEPRTALAEDSGRMFLPHFSIALPELSLPEPVVHGYDYCHENQPYYLLLIVEKTTQDDILKPICRRYGVNYLAGAGFTSITRVRDELRRMQAFGKPARVFYVSDYDPAGDAMPRSVSRQTEYWLKDFSVAGIKIDHIGLTRQQCIDYQLPRTPIKDTDKRKASWEDRHGEGATELDALEALYPGELARIVTDAITPYRDMELQGRLDDAHREADEAAKEAWLELTAEQRTELEQVTAEAEAILKPYREQIRDLNRKLRPLQDRLDAVSRGVADIAHQLDDYLPPRPEPETSLPDESHWLYDSNRNYLDQLSFYRAHKGGR